MSNGKIQPANPLLNFLFKRVFRRSIRNKKSFLFSIEKRQIFVMAVILLSLGLFFAEYQFGQFGIYISIGLSVFTDLFLLLAIFHDIKSNFNLKPFILPFFYSLSFGLFYFLTPATLVSRILLAVVYALGLYSLFLSQNIFVVSYYRTIGLLSGARIVSFVITLISYFFLTNIVFTFHFIILPIILIMITYTYLLVYHTLWSYTLDKVAHPLALWALALSVCLVEIAIVLWFWPSNPTVVSIFLTGFFYICSGLSHIWLEKRLFKGILWEYVWVGVIIFFILILFTSWG